MGWGAVNQGRKSTVVRCLVPFQHGLYTHSVHSTGMNLLYTKRELQGLIVDVIMQHMHLQDTLDVYIYEASALSGL